MKVVVIGGTGKVGSFLTAKLLEAGADVRLLSRNGARGSATPARLEVVTCDLTQDVERARAAFTGVDAVFMLNRLLLEETAEGLLAVQYAKSAGVSRFVYQSIHGLEQMDHVPHVASKVAIERAIVGSGMEWTFLRPNYFFQNDLTAKAGLEKGVYAQPIGMVGVASVDVEDIAEAAAIVLLESGHGGKRLNLVGPEVLTGEGCAAAWAEITGRDVRYVGDVDKWCSATSAFMPAWLNFDLGLMYRHLCTRGLLPEPGDVEKLTAVLERPPRAYRDYVRQQAAEWGLAAT